MAIAKFPHRAATDMALFFQATTIARAEGLFCMSAAVLFADVGQCLRERQAPVVREFEEHRLHRHRRHR